MAKSSRRIAIPHLSHKPSSAILLTTTNVLSDMVEVARPLEPMGQEHWIPAPDQQISPRMFGVPIIEALAMNAEYAVPTVVELCVRRLLNSPDVNVASLLQPDAGDKNSVEKFKRHFDKGKNVALEKVDDSTVFTLLKHYLSSLPEPILTKEAFLNIITPTDLKETLENMPQENKSILKRLLVLFRALRERIKRASLERALLDSFASFFLRVIASPDILDGSGDSVGLSNSNPILPSTPTPTTPTGDKTEKKKDKKDKDKPDLPAIKYSLLVNTVTQFLMQEADKLADAIDDPEEPRTLNGEIIKLRIYRVVCSDIPGFTNLWLTNYRLILQPARPLDFADVPKIPISTIKSIEVLGGTKKRHGASIKLICKDFRTKTLDFDYPLTCALVHENLRARMYPETILSLFAFHNTRKFRKTTERFNWDIFTLATEADRLGLVSTSQDKTHSSDRNGYRISKMNAGYEIPTYPADVIVPNSIAENELKKFAPFRLRSRFPIILWYHKKKGALLARADEPELSLIGEPKDVRTLYKQFGDTKFVDKLNNVRGDPIITYDLGDNRTYALGYQSRIEFLRMRSNQELNAMFEGMHGTGPDARDAQNRWLQATKETLESSITIASHLDNGSPILLHHHMFNDCDYVLSSLAQLMLDGYYRTLKGFAVLIEKEWVYYGYDFARKTSLARENEDETSPAFQLFIECTWQIMLQYQTYFAFTESLLVYILDSLYSSKYGNFLGNCEREREAIKPRSLCLWTAVHEKRKRFINPYYDDSTEHSVIKPSTTSNDVRVWHAYYSRFRQTNAWAKVRAKTSQLGENKSKRDKEPLVDGESSSDDNDGGSDQTASNESSEETPANSASASPKKASSKSKEVIKPASKPTKTRSTSTPEPLESARNTATPLDLSRLQLVVLPPELRYELAAKVKSLNLARNFFQFLPNQVLHMSNLTSLNMDHNPINNLPVAMINLMATCLPFLQELSLAKTGLERIHDELARLSGLRILKLNDNNLTDLPVELAKLSELDILDVRNNKLSTISPALSKLIKLKVLAAGNNSIEALPVELQSMAALQVLDISLNHLNELPEFICAITSLIALHLDHNSMKSLPASIIDLTRLQFLNISGNEVVELPKDLYKLRSLRVLRANDNKIKSLPTKISGMAALQELHLTNNQLVTFPVVALTLPNLTKFHLESNYIESVPTSIHQMTALVDLNLNNCKIQTLDNCPGVGQLTRLRSLQLRDNNFQTLPITLALLSGTLETLDVDPDKMLLPPSDVCSRGVNHILRFLKDKITSKECSYKMRVILVGQVGAGKSAILQGLTGRPPSKASKLSVEGVVDIGTLVLPGINFTRSKRKDDAVLTVWDYQDLESSSTCNRFYMNERSLVVFAIDMAKDPELKGFAHFAQIMKHSFPKTLIILVATHTDELSKEINAKEVLANLEQTSVKKYPNVKAYVTAVPTSTKGLNELRQAIERVVADLPFLGEEIPSSYLQLEKLVACEAKRIPPVVTWQEFEGMAHVCDIKTEDSVKAAARALHNIGSLYYLESTERAGRRLILEPRYLALFFATFLKNGRDSIKDGVIRARDLKNYIKGPMFPDNLHAFLFFLLEKNGIAYKYINYQPATATSPSKAGANAAASPDDAVAAAPPVSSKPALVLQPTKTSLWAKAKAVTASPPTETKPGSSVLSVTQQLIVANSLPEWWSLWVPLLLPAEPPADLEKRWPEKHLKGIQFGRRYHIPLNAEEYFWRVMVRLLHFCPREIYWRYGLLIEQQGIEGEQILVVFKPEDKIVDVWVRATDKLTSIYRHVFETLETIKRITTRINITTTIPCVHCVVTNRNPVFYYTIEACEKAAMKASYVYCNDTRPIKVEYVCPDLSMHLAQGPLRINFSELEMSKKIGEGAAAEVYKGNWGDKVVAVKVLRISGAKIDTKSSGNTPSNDDMMKATTDKEISKAFAEFRREVWLMSSISHPTITEMHGLVMSPLCIVTEFVPGGNLFDFIHSKDKDKERDVPWPVRVKIAVDISAGLQHMHSFSPPITHRDVKTPNILLTTRTADWEKQSVIAKVADFGLTGLAPTMAGREVDNPVWLAPEVMNSEDYNEKADVYSFGVIMYELLTKKEFLGHFSFMVDIERHVVSGQRPELPTDEETNLVPEYIKLMMDCWAQDPEARPTFAAATARLVEIRNKYFPSVALPPSTWQHELKYQTITIPKLSPLVQLTSSSQIGAVKEQHADQGALTGLLFMPEMDAIWLSHTSGLITIWFKANSDGSTTTSPALKDKVTALSAAQRGSTTSLSSSGSSGGAPRQRDSASGLVGTSSPSFSIAAAAATVPAAMLVNPVSYLGTITAHGAAISAIARQQSRVWTASIDRSIVVWQPIRHTGTGSNAGRWAVQVLSFEQITSEGDWITQLYATDQYMLATSNLGIIRAYDFAKQKWKKKVIYKDTDKNNIASIVTLPHRNEIWMACFKKILRLDRSLKPIDSFVAHDQRINSLIVHNQLVWSASSDNTIKVWDPATAQFTHTLLGHQDKVYALASVGKQVWSCGKDQTLLIWDASNFTILSELVVQNSEPCKWLTVAHREVLSACEDGVMMRWSVDEKAGLNTDEIGAAFSASSRSLDTTEGSSKQELTDSDSLSNSSASDTPVLPEVTGGGRVAKKESSVFPEQDSIFRSPKDSPSKLRLRSTTDAPKRLGSGISVTKAPSLPKDDTK